MANILLIDDDDNLRSFARKVLEAHGHAVREAATGDRGVRSHRDEPADVVVCDIFMDRQDGLESIRQLRSEFPGVPILAVSGGSAEIPGDYLPTAKALGASAVLAKPFTPEQLRDAVNALLGGGAA